MSEMVAAKMKVRRWLINGFAAAGLGAVVYGALGQFFPGPVSAQSDRFLEQRLNQVEQRFYTIESRLNRIESESRSSAIRPQLPSMSSTTEVELQYLRTQVDSLRTRLGEAECGLLKVDERTLTAAQRRKGVGSVSGNDRCRQDWGSPVVLSARP
jgi:hypothetical protein